VRRIPTAAGRSLREEANQDGNSNTAENPRRHLGGRSRSDRILKNRGRKRRKAGLEQRRPSINLVNEDRATVHVDNYDLIRTGIWWIVAQLRHRKMKHPDLEGNPLAP